MSNIIELENCPKLNFIENMTLQETEDQIRELYAGYYRGLTGRDPEIGDIDTVNLSVKVFYAMKHQTMQCADTRGRMEMLKTSTGSALDALAALTGLARKAPEQAAASVRFSLEEPRSVVVATPAEMRMKTEDGKCFNSLECAEIKAGEDHADVVVQAEEAGAESNDILPSAIKVLVDLIPYISGVSSTAPSTGELDTEDDDSLTRRTYLAPSVYSCAGPRDAYEYYTREWRGDVAGVRIVSPRPDKVNIYFVIEDETGLRLPSPTELAGMVGHMDNETICPLCDHVSCLAPEGVDYTISFTYWIIESNQRSADEIQSKVTAAVKDSQTRQRKLGWDINPMELIARLRAAGAKRVKLTAPADMTMQTIMLLKRTGVTTTYGELEDD